jgi:hypothetical protein
MVDRILVVVLGGLLQFELVRVRLGWSAFGLLRNMLWKDDILGDT